MMRNRMHCYNNIRLWSCTGNREKKIVKIIHGDQASESLRKENLLTFQGRVHILQHQLQRILMDGEHVLTRLFHLLTFSLVVQFSL